MGKIVCEKCGTEFKFEIAKNFESCLVCGASFSDEVDSVDNESTVQDDGLMYFDEIATKYTENPEYNGVRAYCGECGKSNSLDLDKFDKLVDKKYVILKGNKNGKKSIHLCITKTFQYFRT